VTEHQAEERVINKSRNRQEASIMLLFKVYLILNIFINTELACRESDVENKKKNAQ
jgi:hypothetical protein